ncbi:MAG TPA: low-specificity L-threonine aldolase [Burkholderiaceae bacterium]|jgi:threonine aldolase|nr:low-specificity L-threonine aldolase [Burkholderiaceae bacterium]
MIDLRSDTVTRPTAAMRDAMFAAPLGDDVFGDDPSVNQLQARIAEVLGKEDALFMPSGTQSNLAGLMSHCGRGDEYLVGQMAHTYRWEGGGGAVLGSIQPQPISHQSDGTLALADIEAAIKPDDPHFARTRLLALENTFGGACLPLPYLREATGLARRHGLATHLDGARLFNAAVAQADASVDATARDAYAQARDMAALFDSVSVCFSKGLGAPVGSCLVGTRELVTRARRVRKLAGGAMRQAGLLAAGAHFALDHHVERLREDHANARRLAAGLAGIPGVSFQAPQTNILFVDLAPELVRERSAARWGGEHESLVEHLRAAGVLATGMYRLRFVTHLDVNARQIDAAVQALREAFAA